MDYLSKLWNPKKGEFKDTFFSEIFNQHQIKTTIIFNSNNHLLKTPIKKGLNTEGMQLLWNFDSI